MKAYLITTGAVFALLTAVHLWRVSVEPHLARDPWYVFVTLGAAAFCVWAVWLLLRAARSGAVGSGRHEGAELEP